MMPERSTLLVGIENDPAGGLRCFLGSRHRGLYVIVDEPEAMERVRNAWANTRSHILMPVPSAERIFSEADRA